MNTAEYLEVVRNPQLGGYTLLAKRPDGSRYSTTVSALTEEQLKFLHGIVSMQPKNPPTRPPAQRPKVEPGFSMFWTDGQGNKIDLAVGEGTHTCRICHWRYTPNSLPGDNSTTTACHTCRTLEQLGFEKRLDIWEKYQKSVRDWRIRITLGLIVVSVILTVWIGWTPFG